MEHTNVDGALFAFGYKESGSILCCCSFIDAADDRNCSFDFIKYRPLRNRHAHVRRVIILEDSDHKMDLCTVYRQSLRHRLKIMTSPSDKMNFAKLQGADSNLYNSWITLLDQANKKNSEDFYMKFPIYPQLIILYENRLHLNEFLKIYIQINNNMPLLHAQKKCDELVILTKKAAQISCENEHLKPETIKNKLRNMIISILQQCNTIEQEIIKLLQASDIFID